MFDFYHLEEGVLVELEVLNLLIKFMIPGAVRVQCAPAGTGSVRLILAGWGGSRVCTELFRALY